MIRHDERLHRALFSINDGAGCELLTSGCLSMSSRNILPRLLSNRQYINCAPSDHDLQEEKHKERESQNVATVVVVSRRKYSEDGRGARDIS